MEKKYHRGPSFLNSINYKLYWVLNIPFSQNLTNFLKFLSLISFFSSSILEVLVQMFCVPLQQNALIVFFVNLNYLVYLFFYCKHILCQNLSGGVKNGTLQNTSRPECFVWKHVLAPEGCGSGCIWPGSRSDLEKNPDSGPT